MFHYRAWVEGKNVDIATFTADGRYVTPNTLAGDMIDCVGGKWNRLKQVYKLSLGQYRLMCDLIDAGYFPLPNPNRDYAAELDRFYHPETGEELSRTEARAKFAPAKRCSKTLELAL